MKCRCGAMQTLTEKPWRCVNSLNHTVESVVKPATGIQLEATVYNIPALSWLVQTLLMQFNTHACMPHTCFSLTPARYEKAQASDVICNRAAGVFIKKAGIKRAAHPGSGLIQKECCVGRAYSACVYAPHMLVRSQRTREYMSYQHSVKFMRPLHTHVRERVNLPTSSRKG